MKHELCGKEHRTDASLASCITKYERATARLDKVLKENARREQNQIDLPPYNFICQRRAQGGATGQWERILSSLKKDYPPPEDGKEWNIWDVVSLYVESLRWPVDNETATEMILEKHYTGAYISIHPLQLPGVAQGIMASEAMTPEVLLARMEPREEEDGSLEDDS